MEEAIVSRLLNDVPVAALVAARVYAGRRPQGSDYPSVVVNRISGTPIYTDEGETGLAQARLQIDCWGESYASAKYTARAVKDALSAFHGVVNGVTFQNVLLDAERDLSESGGNVSEYPFRTGLDFVVWYEN